jgi:hypothetical protein
MKKQEKPKQPKNAYAAPKLKTHGDVAKLTKHHDHDHHHKKDCPGSTLFDFQGRDN